MRFFRSQRVESLIQEQLAKIIIREVEFPAGALVTITNVEVDKKLERARVRLSVIPAFAEKAALDAVVFKTGYLQHLLLMAIHIKPLPHLIFEIDHGNQNMAVVEKLIEKADIEPIAEGEENQA